MLIAVALSSAPFSHTAAEPRVHSVLSVYVLDVPDHPSVAASIPFMLRQNLESPELSLERVVKEQRDDSICARLALLL